MFSPDLTWVKIPVREYGLSEVIASLRLVEQDEETTENLYVCRQELDSPASRS